MGEKGICVEREVTEEWKGRTESNIFSSLRHGVNLAKDLTKKQGMKSLEEGFDREKKDKKAFNEEKKLRGRMVKKNKMRHKSKRVKERGSKAVPSISCRVVVALTVG